MLELLKIKRDINWLIDQIKCLIRKSDLDSPLSATAWSANHSTITGNPYIIDCFVWFEDKVYKSLINNNIYPPTNATYWANLGLGHLLLEEQTDWNATTGRALLKNKPDLSQYALDENLVHKTGNEIINGIKDFTNFIIVSSISSNSGQLVLASGGTQLSISDDNEQIIANQEFIAPSLRIPEGTSTQFLKADGSIDNTIYAENANVIHTTGNEVKNGSLTVIDAGGGFGLNGISVNSYGIYGQSENAPAGYFISNNAPSIYGFSENGQGGVFLSNTGNGVQGISQTNFGIYGQSTDGVGISGSSNTNLAGLFNTNTGTKIISFLANSIEQAYILATGLFKANKILINTTTDNGIDALQVNGSVSSSAATTANQVVIKSQLDLKANDANVLHKTGNETKTGTLRVQNTANTGYSIEGIATGTGIGVYAESIEEDNELPAGIAVYGVSPSGIGVKGYSEGFNNGVGVFAESYATALQAISYEGTAASFNSYQGIGLEVYGNGTVAIDCNLGTLNKGLVVNSGLSSTGNPIEVIKNDVTKFIVNQEGQITTTQYKVSALNTAPATSTSTGTLGEIRITATHIYVCTATNTWVRTALTSW